MKKIIALAFLFLNASLIGSAQITDFTILDSDDNHHNLYDYLSQGNVVVMKYYLVNCSICASFAPKLEEIYEETGEGQEGVVIFTMNVNNDPLYAIQNWQTNHEMTIPSLHGQASRDFWGDNVYPMTNTLGAPQIAVVKPNVANPEMSEIVYVETGGMTSTKIEELKNAIEENRTQVGISDIANFLGTINVFPNPASDYLTVQLKSIEVLKNKRVNIQIFNLEGKLIKEQKIIVADNTIEDKIEITDLNNGTYIIQLVNDKKVMYVESFQKM